MTRAGRARAAAVAVIVAGSPGPAGAGQGPQEDARSDMSSGTDERGLDEAAALATAAQARLDAGDREGAIGLWWQAYAALPGGFGYAPRRAALALAIAEAEAAAFRESGDPARLGAAIAALDAYLGGIEPTDDENRVVVEGRRAELSDMYKQASRPEGPPPPVARPGRRGLDRRAGRAAAGLAGAALAAGAVAVAGALSGRAADRALARATARPCSGADPDDPCGSDGVREASKADALGDGLRANRMALIGVSVAGALLAASAAALIAGAVRGGARVQARGAGLTVRF